MKKGMVMAISFVMLFFYACVDQGPEDHGVLPVQVISLTSIDQYDGVLIDEYGQNSVHFDSQPEVSNEARAIFTFELPENVVSAKAVELRIYATDFVDSCASSPGQDPHAYLFLKVWNTQEWDYDQWQDCTYYWYGLDGPWYDPSGCVLAPHQLWPMPELEMRHEDHQPNKGWYTLDSPYFLDFIRSLPNRQVGDKIYFSFEVDMQVLGDLVSCLGHPTFSISFEDGENHGGTGNLPTLTISY